MPKSKKLTCGTIRGELIYTIAGIADKIGVHPGTARRYVINDDLAWFKVGRQFRVTESDLCAFIETRKGTPFKNNAIAQDVSLLKKVSSH